ncbi:hypothetical protein NKW84_18260 [Acetobacter senegalensis]|uniref:hypothetical protein n=1 Tax=Acetobacter senegalensis TaxID=446692 RepID=UPI0020A23001|nr:hypothetical protein [Acetobacter senegalensis]MCP1197759.1 hypothetical protein [Acetobacter senegalensis]
MIKVAVFFFLFFFLSNSFSKAQEVFDADYSKENKSYSINSEYSIVSKKKSYGDTILNYPVNYFSDTLVENMPVDWFPQGYETVMLGGQPSILSNSKGKKIEINPHQSLSIWGSPYGSFNAGCSLCVFSTGDVANGAAGQAALSGLDPRLGAFSIAHGDNAIAALYIGQSNNLTRIVLPIKSFDSYGFTLEKPLSPEQISSLHHGMYVSTNVRAQDMIAVDDYGRPTNYVYTGIVSGWGPSRINVYGWSVLGAQNKNENKYIKLGLVPDTKKNASDKWSNLDNKSSYTFPVAYIGDPGKYFGENDYITMDMDRVYGLNASSNASSYERNEFDMRWSHIKKNHQASFHGYTLSFECNECLASYPFTEDSYGYLVNGPYELPAAYVAQVDGDALEYKGYSTWVPGDGAANPSIVGSQHIMFDFSSHLSSNNKLHFGARSYHDLEGISDWRGYDVRLGLTVDGKRERDRFQGGSSMSDLAWNLNGKLGTICLVQPDGKTEGVCLEGNGSENVPGQLYAQQVSAKVVSASLYLSAPQFGTSDRSQIFTQIKGREHSEGDRVWCHNCLNPHQSPGQGTGRWIYLDRTSVWRGDDGYPARD